MSAEALCSRAISAAAGAASAGAAAAGELAFLDFDLLAFGVAPSWRGTFEGLPRLRLEVVLGTSCAFLSLSWLALGSRSSPSHASVPRTAEVDSSTVVAATAEALSVERLAVPDPDTAFPGPALAATAALESLMSSNSFVLIWTRSSTNCTAFDIFGATEMSARY